MILILRLTSVYFGDGFWAELLPGLLFILIILIAWMILWLLKK